MKSEENQYRSFKQDHIEWSPIVGVWIRRRWLHLGRVHKYLDTPSADPRNMIRDCKKHGITNLQQITQDDLDVEKGICMKEIDRLAKQAPQLRRQHLKRLVDRAEQRGDKENVRILLAILHREAVRKIWRRRVHYSTGKVRARAPVAVKVPMEDGGFEEFKT